MCVCFYESAIYSCSILSRQIYAYMIRSFKFVVSPVLKTGQAYTLDAEIPEVVLGVLILET